MTNNQREFQKEVNRIQRELAKLQQSHHFKHIAPIPEQPKRITRKHIEELKLIKGRHLVQDEFEIKKLRPSPQDKPLKGRKRGQTYIDEPTPYKPVDERKTRSDKGTKRGALTPEERARRNAKRIETLAKSNKPRKTRSDKGTHLPAEERARRNAKRLETIAKKSRPTTPEYAPTNTTAPTPYNMLEWILDRLIEAKSYIIEHLPMESFGAMATRSSRISYIEDLQSVVASNLDSESYYNELANRQEEIASHIDTIVYDSDQADVDNSYSYLYQLLTPTNELDLETLKRISDNAENYNAENY